MSKKHRPNHFWKRCSDCKMSGCPDKTADPDERHDCDNFTVITKIWGELSARERLLKLKKEGRLLYEQIHNKSLVRNKIKKEKDRTSNFYRITETRDQ